MHVVPILNPAAGDHPFVKRALASIPCAPEVIDFEALLSAYEIWVAMNGDLQALVVLSFGIGPLKAIPSVVLFYSEGDKECREALIEKITERMKEEGHSRYLAGNWSGRDDAPWLRLFKNGGEFERVGSTFLVEVG